MARRLLILLVVGALVAWAIVSCATGGLVFILVSGTPEQGPWLQRVRDVVLSWGRLAPIVYVLAVIAEVVVAPIPGPMLYAPAGAIFGGLLGGTLSLIGNVAGAAIACALGGMLGERVLSKNTDASRFAQYRERLRDRGVWVILLLRANPLTSSDLVSYAAGLAGLPVWKVALGTLIGMAPLCYLQAYFAQRIFEVVPGWLLLAGAVALVVAVALMLMLGIRRPAASPSARQR